MKKARVLSMVCATVLLLSCCFGVPTVAASSTAQPTLRVSDATGGATEDVTVTVSMENNPGICSAQLWLHYDEGLSLKSVSDATLLDGGVFGGNLTEKPYGLLWLGDTTNVNNTKNGTLVTLTFTVDADALRGDYAVWVEYKSDEIFDVDFTSKDFTCVAGTITVVCRHKYTEYKSNYDATCFADGTMTAACENGCGTKDTKTDVGSKLEHVYLNYVSNNDATCFADGTETATCGRGCETTDTRKVEGSKLTHSYTNYVSDNNATCLADGTMTAECDHGCGTKDVKDEAGTQLHHSFKNYVSNNDATCFADGTETAQCEHDCGIENVRVVEGSKLTHQFKNYVSNNDATCFADGTETAVCEHGCDTKDTRTVTGSKLTHQFKNYVSNNDATCFKDGTETAVCEHGCNTTDERTDEGSKLTHQFTNYVSNNDATYFEDGTETALCNHGCNTPYTRTEVGSKLVDSTAPTGKVTIVENAQNALLNKITFGFRYPPVFDVTITAQDAETGIASIEYYKATKQLSETELAAVTEWTAGTSFSMNDAQAYVYAKIINRVGGVAYIYAQAS